MQEHPHCGTLLFLTRNATACCDARCCDALLQHDLRHFQLEEMCACALMRTACIRRQPIKYWPTLPSYIPPPISRFAVCLTQQRGRAELWRQHLQRRSHSVHRGGRRQPRHACRRCAFALSITQACSCSGCKSVAYLLSANFPWYTVSLSKLQIDETADHESLDCSFKLQLRRHHCGVPPRPAGAQRHGAR